MPMKKGHSDVAFRNHMNKNHPNDVCLNFLELDLAFKFFKWSHIMNTYKVLTKIYETWGEINRISPLPSADDLRFDAQYGRTSTTNKQQ